MSDETHILELLPACAIGCLDEDEARLVAEHLASCLACRAELRAYQTIADQLALPAPDAVPPPDLKRRLLERVQSPRPLTAPQPRALRWPLMQRLLPAWGLVSLLLILALAVVNLSLWQRVNDLAATTGPAGMRAISLSGTGAAPQASGFVIVGADGQNGALVVDQLPPLDEARQYQVWLIRDGQRTSGAVFSTDEVGYGGTRIRAPESLFAYSAIGVTIEPAGGSPGPTGDDVLSGPLFAPSP